MAGPGALCDYTSQMTQAGAGVLGGVGEVPFHFSQVQGGY